MKIFVFSMLFCSLLPNWLKGQGVMKGVELSVGYGIAEQDRRLFEFSQKQKVLDLETTKNDHQFELLLSKPIVGLGTAFNMYAGFGYSLFTSKFSRPFDPNYFPKERSAVLRYISLYSIHNLKLYSALNVYIINTKETWLSVIIPFSLNININKNVKAGGNVWNKNKWNFAFYNFEIYSGLNYGANRFNFSMNYRLFNYQEIDEVIFNQVLFKVTNQKPAFLKNNYEVSHLNKILFNVSYRLHK